MSTLSFNEKVVHLIVDAVAAKLNARTAQRANNPMGYETNKKLLNNACQELASHTHTSLSESHERAAFGADLKAWYGNIESLRDELLQKPVSLNGFSFGDYLELGERVYSLNIQANAVTLRLHKSNPEFAKRLAAASIAKEPLVCEHEADRSVELLRRLNKLEEARSADSSQMLDLDVQLQEVIEKARSQDTGGYPNHEMNLNTYPPFIQDLLQSKELLEAIHDVIDEVVSNTFLFRSLEPLVRNHAHTHFWKKLQKFGVLKMFDTLDRVTPAQMG